MTRFTTPWILLLSFTSILYGCTPQAPHTSAPAAGHSNVMASSSTDNHQDLAIAAEMEWEALQPTTLSAMNDGRISQLLVADGQQVHSGQYLLQLKTVTTNHTTHNRINQTAKAQAFQKWQQDKKLYAQGFISQAAVAKSAAAYRQASLPQTTTKPAVQPTNTLWLQAPFNGIIKPLVISTGTMVKNGQQLLHITPLDHRRLKLVVAQDNNIPLAVGQRVRISGEQTDVWLQISELPTMNTKQYAVAYVQWPTDLTMPDLSKLKAHIVIRTHATGD